MKTFTIFLALTIAAAAATVACGKKPAMDPTTATGASGEMPSTDMPATPGSDMPATGASSMP